MPELRQNMATKDWVIIATERAKRPHYYIEPERPLTAETQTFHDPTCPFCPGNEELDLETERLPATGPWQTRVVANKFPALSKEGEVTRHFDGVHRCISGVGYHEIVVEHPQHNNTLALMRPIEIESVLQTFYNRGWNILRDARVEQIVYFENHGDQAGASLKHPHSQIVALPVVPNDIRHRIEEAQRYFDDTGDCVHCVMMRDELDKGVRLVSVNDHFVAFVLYAAPSPFHMWIVPRRHSVNFLFAQKEELAGLAQILQDALSRLYFGLRDPSYNLVIRTAPAKEISKDYLHWYVAIVPRLGQAAGFELGSGMFINPSLPEESAAFLREVKG
ncbi:MAG TPA: galactose-1-phosphate uridylyltransferase [Anaerolineae bacterium]|nr:galactose-1-phosphate uridylyltransferase [Anaerolineae bacterium]